MLPDLNDLTRLNKSQVKAASEVLARVFQDYPLLVGFIPDESERKNKSRYLFEFVIRWGVLYGEVYATSPNLEGVAVWLPPGKVHITLCRAIRSGILTLRFKLGRKFMFRMKSTNDYLLSINKRHAAFPHWYLFYIGVDTQFQGKGHASTLLTAMLARIDSEQMPCYLRTQKKENVPLFEHYGFRIVHESIIPQGTSISPFIYPNRFYPILSPF